MQNYLPQPPYQQPYRNFNMAQNYNNGFKVISVASDSEINNVAEDYSGMPLYFHNRNTNEIIIRQFDISTGLTTTKKYIKSDGTEGDLTGVKSKTDINTYKKEFDAINERIDGLKDMIENLSLPKPEIIERGGKK